MTEPGGLSEATGESLPDAAEATEANERFAERLAEDLSRVLGVGIALESVTLDGQTPVMIEASGLVDGQVRELRGVGPTILEASRDLIRRAAELRLAAAWWRMIGPA
ncbi:MAG TPA: hypothetical protein VET90_10155 [Candidatus Binatus sp.]|nr:hypothetical protein [Candidatus Binatus sp.]